MKIINCKTQIEWENKRKHGIGGSDITTLMGLHDYATPLNVYYSKIGESQPPSPQTKAAFLRGHIIERGSIEWYNETHSEQATHLDKVIWVKNENEILRYSPDGIINGDGLIECKSWRGYYDEPKPDAYGQLQWGLGVSGLEWGVIVWFDSNLAWQEKEYLFDEKFFQKQKEYGVKWYNDYVVKRIPPPEISAYDALLLYPEAIMGKTVEPIEDYLDLKDISIRNNSKIRSLTKENEAIKEKFKMGFDDAETMIDNEGNIVATYKNIERKGYTVESSKSRKLNLKLPRGLK